MRLLAVPTVAIAAGVYVHLRVWPVLKQGWNLMVTSYPHWEKGLDESA